MFYSSKGVTFDEEGRSKNLSIRDARLKIRKNFDPNIKKKIEEEIRY